MGLFGGSLLVWVGPRLRGDDGLGGGDDRLGGAGTTDCWGVDDGLWGCGRRIVGLG